MARNPDPLHLSKLASSRLKPFDWAREREIRAEDVPVFKAAASAFDHIIAVRATNEHSLGYIGRTHFTAKPIDCKPKTASQNAFRNGQLIACAGLVVDPTLLPDAFIGDKQIAARDCWGKFTQGHSEQELDYKVYRRQESVGFYAVDTYKTSERYGCLMLSNVNPPDNQFRLSIDAYQAFKRDHMRYIHGDYDLYGLINVTEVLRVSQASGGTGLAEKPVHTERLHGMTSFHSARFHEIRRFLNAGIGAEMIQHGAQDTFGHGGDKLYVFTPVGGAYVLEGSESAIRDVYELVFKERPIERSF